MTRFTLRTTKRFERQFKLCKRRGYPIDEFVKVLNALLADEPLPARHRAHMLTGDRQGQWECHIRPDWLLVWERHEQELVLVMIGTGTHADLFN